MPHEITEKCSRHMEVKQGKEMPKFLPELDLLYVTRIQKERFPDPLEYEKVRGVYVVDREAIKGTKEHFRIMHPLPRVDEISVDVDSTPAALYFRQAANGIPVREAIIDILGKVKK
jgi:aspartate carbamoyltransferase catalytic subunit